MRQKNIDPFDVSNDAVHIKNAKILSKSNVRMRRQLGENQDWMCCYCGTKMKEGKEWADHPDVITIEHVVPKHKGGSDHPDNLVGACRWCNNKRGHLDVDPNVFVNIAVNVRRAHYDEIQMQKITHHMTAGEKKAFKLEQENESANITVFFKDGVEMKGRLVTRQQNPDSSAPEDEP